MSVGEIGPATFTQFGKWLHIKALARAVASTVDEIDVVAIAEKLYGKTRHEALVRVAKSATDSIGTTGAGAELYSVARVSAEAAEATYRASVLGRMAPLRRVPSAVPLAWCDTRPSFGWVGERRAIPATVLSLDDGQIDPAKIAATLTVSNESLKHSPIADTITRDASRAVVGALDKNFLDPTVAAENDHPASVTNGVTPIDADSPSTPTLVKGVLGAMLDELNTAGSDLGRPFFLMPPVTAISLALMETTLGTPAFETMGATGGSLVGVPVLVSRDAPIGQLTLVDADEVLLADDGTLENSVSKETMLDQDSDPQGNTHMSMFGTESTAIKIIRRISWRMRRPFISIATNFVLPIPSTTE
jgi:HK97 family phage major capsid protein